MSRSFSHKKRNSRLMRRKPVMLIIAEGKNKTESLYFDSFKRQESLYSIQILKAGSRTDPAQLMNIVDEAWDSYELDAISGDVAYVVVDLDLSEEKAKQIRRIDKLKPHINFIVSNPCFEVWFLQHYRYSTRPFISSDAVINELKHYLPNYKKNSNVALVINDMVNNAIRNIRKVSEHFLALGYKWPSVDMNPWTDAYKIIEQIIGKG